MTSQRPKKEYPAVYEKAVPIILGILAVAAVIMVVASILVVLGVFN